MPIWLVVFLSVAGTLMLMLTHAIAYEAGKRAALEQQAEAEAEGGGRRPTLD